MNIGFVTPTKPYPPNEGGRIVMYNHLSRLAERGHDVHVYSTVDERSAPSPPDVLSSVVDSCQYFIRDKSVSAYFRSHDRPFSVASRHVSELKAELRRREETLDVLVVEHTHMASYLHSLSVPSCLCVHNVEHTSLVSNARSLFPSPKSVPFFLDASRMFLFERDLYKNSRADSFAFLSKRELRDVTESYPNTGETAWYSPVGVNTKRFEETALPDEFENSEKRIVFTGTMRYPPNIRAVEWFVEEVFSKVRDRVPEAEFFIVGKSPPPVVRDLAYHSGVTVTGMVDETAGFIAHADVSVVPLREGTGVQIKLIEALAAGNSTVTTSVGTEGTAVLDETHALIRDSPEEYVDAVCRVLNRPEEFAEMRRRAQELVAEAYGWDVVMDKFESRLEALS